MLKPGKNKTKVKCLPPQSKPYYQSEKLSIVRELFGRQPCNNCPISESYGRWSANIWNHSAFTKLTHRKSLENLTFLHTGNPIKSPLPLSIHKNGFILFVQKSYPIIRFELNTLSFYKHYLINALPKECENNLIWII